jgi:2-amino-4-hydroxy-6-hydroxymethyldihydropteridine diphosphokinase
MNQAIIVLGSNIDKEKNLPDAVRVLGRLCAVAAVSSVYETVPVGLTDQPNFFNAAVLIETELDALQLKEKILSRVERRLQRQRTADKNAPRTIDADIILFNDAIFDYGRAGECCHHIPDPDLLQYPHVTVPVAEIAPHMPHPETGEPLSAIARRLMAQATATGVLPLWKRSDITLEVDGEA